MPNRLADEKSPYLLQHANNPVDWYPWGDEAFEKAKREDKPVFLSIGYSTCHWCHVMERESFENDAIARMLNEHFVSIKVDREERPDIDRIYMMFVQASTGSGGWPMSVFLTPERKPFYGGTYFPPDNRYGRPGFASLLYSLANAWRSDRMRVEESGAQVLHQLHAHAAQHSESAGEVGREVHTQVYDYFRRSFDPRLGGFGGAPKFPRPSVLLFLLRYYVAEREQAALDMVLVTLREMAKGGMNDQLGGGFHRYSVDEYWFVPHFEKMLYDQAQLAIAYLEAYQITRDAQYAQVARSIFKYVERDLTYPQGGFFSAEDADSVIDPADPHEKGEGAFYVFSKSELDTALGNSEAFCKRFGVKTHGNVDQDPHGEFTGKNILYQAGEDYEGSAADIQKALAVRATKPRPHLDDKILTAWNGLMISAFAKGAQILGDASLGSTARRAVDFIRASLWRDGVLLRRWSHGDAAIAGFLDDHAFLILGLLDLYETTFERRDLDWAMELAVAAIEKFEDPEGGFFSTPEGQADLVMRLKDDYDGAEPSGNSAMVFALARIARMTGTTDARDSAERAVEAFSGRLRATGPGLPYMLCAHSFLAGKPMEIVLAGPESSDMLAKIRSSFLPNAVVVRAEHLPEPRPAIDGKPTVYVCENFACQLPVTDMEAIVF